MATATATITVTDTATAKTSAAAAAVADAHLEASRRGFSDAHAYDLHRPSYPPAAVHSLLSHLWLVGHSQARVVEVAAGTGKLTEQLAARDEGFEIVAVEPTESMRHALAAKRLRGVAVRDGAAEGMAMPGGWADGVIAAQSFHWFANHTALAEMRRVMKPGAKLGMIWNIEDYNQPADWKATSPWEQTLKERILKLEGSGPPRFRHDTWPKAFEEQKHFAAPVQTEVQAWTVFLGKEALWERIHTLSQVYTMAEEEKAAFRTLFDEAVVEGNAEFNDKGEIGVHGVTYMAWSVSL
ncbi:putative methyltransferase [Escovopsis weberi]|uniref:Putative methyltransferase n=1 Tax=Escovopsis weberi TaxID=150374 RepID=A0A0M9VTV7_ESCWE|nr:putative methyltransferase [Escovopsis weberi]